MMLVDCQTCPVREVHCGDCMVTALGRLPLPVVGEPDRPGDVPLDAAEQRAVSTLAAAGLVDRRTARAARARLEPSRIGRRSRAV